MFLIASSNTNAQEVTYAEVGSIFNARCVMCHMGENAPLGLRLDSMDGLLKGSQKGPVVRAGDPAGSELVRRIKGITQPRMPLTGPPFLSDEEIALIERWVASGLKAGAATAATLPTPAKPPRPAPGEAVTYAHVVPIFATRCAKCHTEQGLMGPAPEGYRLTSYEATLASADRVRVVPRNPDASELVRRIRGQSRPRMPFDGPPYLSDDDISLITEWIKQGARSTDGKPARIPTGARLRLLGTLTGQWRLDALNLVVTASTRIDKAPHTGDFVEMRGRLREDGAVVVERLRRR